jgi:hypothetical protein
MSAKSNFAVCLLGMTISAPAWGLDACSQLDRSGRAELLSNKEAE